MKDTKIPFGCRLTPLVLALIKLEKKINGGSDGDAVERLVLLSSTSAEAHDLILKESAKSPQGAAALRIYEKRFKVRH